MFKYLSAYLLILVLYEAGNIIAIYRVTCLSILTFLYNIATKQNVVS